jgi:hypothetical protein
MRARMGLRVCIRCGEFGDDDVCAKCGEKVVRGSLARSLGANARRAGANSLLLFYNSLISWRQVATSVNNNMWKNQAKASSAPAPPQSVGAIPSAFVGAARLAQEMGCVFVQIIKKRTCDSHLFVVMRVAACLVLQHDVGPPATAL